LKSVEIILSCDGHVSQTSKNYDNVGDHDGSDRLGSGGLSFQGCDVVSLVL
jgi:hypothetical protein